MENMGPFQYKERLSKYKFASKLSKSIVFIQDIKSHFNHSIPFSDLCFDVRVPILQILTRPSNAAYSIFNASYHSTFTLNPFYGLTLPSGTHIPCLAVASRNNHRKFVTKRATLPPYWENSTWPIPSQLPHREEIYDTLLHGRTPRYR